MERENTRNRKRTREEEEDEKEKIESHESKKQERIIPVSNSNEEKCYEFCDGIGVFDFPWLKDGGVIYKGDDYSLDEHEEMTFSPCSYLDEEASGTFTANFDQNLCVSPTLDGDFYDNKLNDDDDDSFWSLLVDDLEPVDCIWSCVIDQPLDMGFNKGL